MLPAFQAGLLLFSPEAVVHFARNPVTPQNRLVALVAREAGRLGTVSGLPATHETGFPNHGPAQCDIIGLALFHQSFCNRE
jgi:hypothetical protein